MSLGIHACDVHAPKENQFGSLMLSDEEKEAGRRGGVGVRRARSGWSSWFASYELGLWPWYSPPLSCRSVAVKIVIVIQLVQRLMQLLNVTV